MKIEKQMKNTLESQGVLRMKISNFELFQKF